MVYLPDKLTEHAWVFCSDGTTGRKGANSEGIGIQNVSNKVVGDREMEMMG